MEKWDSGQLVLAGRGHGMWSVDKSQLHLSSPSVVRSGLRFVAVGFFNSVEGAEVSVTADVAVRFVNSIERVEFYD
jgi:hypothetical protein